MSSRMNKRVGYSHSRVTSNERLLGHCDTAYCCAALPSPCALPLPCCCAPLLPLSPDPLLRRVLRCSVCCCALLLRCVPLLPCCAAAPSCSLVPRSLCAAPLRAALPLCTPRPCAPLSGPRPAALHSHPLWHPWPVLAHPRPSESNPPPPARPDIGVGETPARPLAAIARGSCYSTVRDLKLIK